ncbi:MAG: oligopeptide transporter, OPT family [Porphyromonadaceae bacterium]|nr:oligopeptide transporter, OPT family [Porphyromonadaceae bacterium]
MQQQEEKTVGLPENAGRELKEGEKYHPIMSPDKNYPEVNFRSVSWGIIMAILFSAAAAYLGLKIGQVFEAAIPIAIIAVGLSTATKRKNALGENIIIQSIGASSGVIVAGAIFTLPAIYILQSKGIDVSVDFYQVFLSSLFGGILGILFLIPFRKYFVSDMHGKYPFPEATATTQVLISGEKGGGQAKPLVIAGLVGGLYDFVVATFGTWAETFTSRVLPMGETLYTKAKLMFSVNIGAAVLGLGYIVGLKYAAIICAGSALVWFVIVPIMSLLGDTTLQAINPIFTGTVDGMPPEQIFSTFARHIGIGGIAMAGIIGIIRSWGIIKSAVGLASSEMKNKGTADNTSVERTQRDLPMKIIVIGVLMALAATFVFFYLGVVDFNIWHAIVGILIVAVIAFLFTTVAANAIAIVGSNPVSGMTLMTLILSSVIMVAVGLKGASGMVAAAIIGGVVCTALSMAGGFITDLKIGYWLGSTPAKQQTWKFLGTLVSAATVGGVMIILNKTYGFGEGGLVAPQANAMAAVIEPLMGGTGAPWLLYGIGATIAIILTLFKVPALAFALGMFIPLSLNAPLLIGGLVAWYVSTRSTDKAINNARNEKGNLVASGFIAGGALMGVVSAIIKFSGLHLTIPFSKETATNPATGELVELITYWHQTTGGQWMSLVAYGALIGFFVWFVLKDKKQA